MHLVFENGERFDTCDRLVRAVAEVLRRSPHCRVEAECRAAASPGGKDRGAVHGRSGWPRKC